MIQIRLQRKSCDENLLQMLDSIYPRTTHTHIHRHCGRILVESLKHLEVKRASRTELVFSALLRLQQPADKALS